MAPTPMIEPLMVCVVLTGMPPTAVPMSVSAPAASAVIAAATWLVLHLLQA